jgi:hypothetical protein
VRTSIIGCTCDSEFQDKTYGKHMRLANFCRKVEGFRCTVCGRHTMGGARKTAMSSRSKGHEESVSKMTPPQRIGLNIKWP